MSNLKVFFAGTFLGAVVLAIVAGGIVYMARREVRFYCDVEDTGGIPTGDILSGTVEKRFVMRAFDLWVVDAGVGPRPIVSSSCRFEEVSR